MRISDFQKQVHDLAKEKGWYDKVQSGEIKELNIGERIVLMHSELSEAYEEFRKSGMQREFAGPSKELPNTRDVYFTHDNPQKPEGLFIELADCIIRILDFAGFYEVDMEHLLFLKHTYNKTRPYRHGNKRS